MLATGSHLRAPMFLMSNPCQVKLLFGTIACFYVLSFLQGCTGKEDPPSTASSSPAQMPRTGQAQLWSSILDSSRATDWTQAGVTGGIPDRTSICTTIAPYGS